MARRKGFEPLTPKFEVWCSIQLSYRRLLMGHDLIQAHRRDGAPGKIRTPAPRIVAWLNANPT